MSTRHDRRLVLLVMCAGYFLVLLDVTIVNVALPSMARDLGATVIGLQWVVDGYAIALAALMLAGGTVGDLHGHRRVVLVGLALFGIASLGCAAAPSVGALVACRAVQGVGAALMLPGTLAVISRAYPDERERARAIGVWAGVGSAALPAGPLLGGVLTEAIGWRAVFLVNAPIVAVALVVAARTVRESVDPGSRRLDGLGVALGGALLAVVTFGIIEAGHDGMSAPVLVALVAAVGLVPAFVAVERTRTDPMLPLALLRRPAFATANAVAGTMNLCALGLLFLLTLYLQDVLRKSALTAGTGLLALFLPLTVLAPLGGRITARLGARGPMVAGLLSAAAGFALLLPLGPDSPYAALLPALLLWGVGLGTLTPAVVAAALGAVPRQRAGLAAAVNNTSRQAGGAIGIALFGTLVGTRASGDLVHGLHIAAAVSAVLYVLAALVTMTRLRA
jgi:DHA2 family methylenomycin A resistance protein-like MFS transporter